MLFIKAFVLLCAGLIAVMVPAMGWAEVVESRHPDVSTGGRYYGWYPMARFVDMTVAPTTDGLRDEGLHRAAHAPVDLSLIHI